MAFSTNYSHQPTVPTGEVSDLEFVLLRAESGEGVINACQFVFTADSGPLTALSIINADENGIYVLLKVPKGVLKYVQNSAQYSFEAESFAIAVLSYNPAMTTLNLAAIDSYPLSTAALIYPPLKMMLYYPSGKDKYGSPELMLLTHVKGERTGLVVYGFADETCVGTGASPASHNPLLTGTGCTGADCVRCFANDLAKCAQCVGSAFLASQFVCAATNCPSSYYVAEGLHCRKCHYSCLTCSGPTRSECLTCDTTTRSFSLGTGECLCRSSAPYVTEGECTISCPAGYSGFAYGGLCRDRCPEYRFHSVDYTSASAPSTTSAISTGEGTDLLEFVPGTPACLQLPGPSGTSVLPSQFTLSFWIYATTAWSPTAKVLVWGFNSFQIRATGSAVELVMVKADGTEISTGLSIAAVGVGQWYFVGASVRQTTTGYEGRLYMGLSLALAEEGQISAAFTFPTYLNTLLVGCTGTRDPATGQLTTTPQTGLGGYVRELVYQSLFYSLASMQSKMNMVYADCLEVHKSVLSYWRLDTLPTASGSTTILLQDGSRSHLTANIPLSGNPTKASSITAGTPQCKTLQEDLGECVDLFHAAEFPHISLEINNFAADYLEPRVNAANAAGVLGTIAGEGDKLEFRSRGCSGTLLQSIGVSLNPDGSTITIERDKYLPQTVYGTHVDVCYFSARRLTRTKLGQVYFARPPEHVSPSNGNSYVDTPATLSFALSGGDQSEGDVLSFYKISKGLSLAMQDTIPLSAADLTTKTVRDSAGHYASLSTAGMDAARYTLIWRPYYMKYVASKSLLGHKNLFILWTIEEAPRVRFQLVPGMADIYQTAVNYKAELYYPDIVGTTQTDGDQMIFCYVGCQYSNRKGQVYTRANGVYPPIWFGEAYGVYNLGANLLYNRLYICWRPASEASTTSAANGQWRAVKELTTAGANAYLRVNLLGDNKDLPEIAAMNPPMTDAVLHEGEYIWFQISKCEAYKMKPSSSGSNFPGKVQVVHVTFTAPDHSTYSTETIWEQTFPVLSDTTTSGFTIGKLRGDPLTCNYTLMDLPWQSMRPGHKYLLIIYSKSFRSAVSDLYLFGGIDDGKQALKFWFTYQEAQFSQPQQQVVVPTAHEISIIGQNFGDLIVPGDGFVETYKLFSVVVNMTTSPQCEIEETSYVVTSWLRDNPGEIRLTGLNLESCVGSVLSVGVTLIKLSTYVGEPRWSYSSTKLPLILGNVTCDPSCLTCSGADAVSCQSCNKGGASPYLYRGQCVSVCGYDQPYVQPKFAAGSSVIKSYECVESCGSGMYLEKTLMMCMRCYEGCGNCTSAMPMSCTTCKGTAIGVTNAVEDYNNTYNESYYFSGMCMFNCPVITNDLISSQPNIVSADEYTKTCILSPPASGSHPISVTLQSEIVNPKQSLILKAITTDPTGSLTSTSWGAHPAEDTSIPGFYSSDSRVFSSYEAKTTDTLNMHINTNAFNYKGLNNEMRVIVKVMTCDSFAFAIAEFFSNTPPTLDSSNIVLAPSSGLTTLSRLGITMKSVSDSDDYYPLLRYKVLLVPRTLAIPDGVSSSTSSSALTILAQLPGSTLTLYSVKLQNADAALVTLKDIYIPPLINGPQTLTTDVTTSLVTCDIIVMCEDRFGAATKIKLSLNVTERYEASKRGSTILGLYTEVMKAKEEEKVDWDLVLRIAHTFRVINPVPSLYYMSYTYCSKDTHCKGKGKCVTNGGWSQCECYSGYTGISCEWTQAEMDLELAITSVAMSFLNSTLLSANSQSSTDSDNHAMDQLANALTGILISPEVVPYSWLKHVVSLCQYMATMNSNVGKRLADYERLNMFTALDYAMKYLLFQLRKVIYQFYVLGESRTISDQFKAEYTAERASISDLILAMRNSLYRLGDSISRGIYPGDEPYSRSFETFEVFIGAVTEASLFNSIGNSLAVRLPGSEGHVLLPADVLLNLRGRVEKDEEFKIRAVGWNQNPYLFSDFHSEVCSMVYNFALLDSQGQELVLNLTSPIVYFLPLANITRESKDEFVKCKYFNSTLVQNQTVAEPALIDVNLLNSSDGEKSLRYPEWHSQLYNSAHLIVNVSRFVIAERVYPDFVDIDGVSSYGNIQKPGQYLNLVPCASYKAGDVAAVIQRKKSAKRSVTSPGFYYDYNSWDAWLSCLGFYVAVGLSAACAVVCVLAKFADQFLIPRLEKIIELHRMEYSEKDDGMADGYDKMRLEGGLAHNPSTKYKAADEKSDASSALGKNVSDSGGKDGSAVSEDLGHSASAGSHNNSSGEGSGGRNSDPIADHSQETGNDGPERKPRVHIKRRRRKILRKKKSLPQSTAGNETTQERLNQDSTVLPSIDPSPTNAEGDKKGEKPVELTTAAGAIQNTTQDLTTIAMMNSKAQNGGEDECVAAGKSFENVGPKDLRKHTSKGKQQIVDIFSEEHLVQREAEEFRIINIYFAGNFLLSMITRTNALFTRVARCVLFFNQLFVTFGLCALGIEMQAVTIDHSEDTKPVSKLVMRDVWVIMVMPIVQALIAYFYTALFKLKSSYAFSSRTMTKYRRC